jgi:hypothetical protein
VKKVMVEEGVRTAKKNWVKKEKGTKTGFRTVASGLF